MSLTQRDVTGVGSLWVPLTGMVLLWFFVFYLGQRAQPPLCLPRILYVLLFSVPRDRLQGLAYAM